MILTVLPRLPYLETLGIDAIWLSPVFASPNVDNGYDVSDYCGILPNLARWQIWKNLIAAAKEVGIKIIIDLVVNRASNEHPWFKKALAGDMHYKNYYIFRSDKNRLPNDLNSFFGGSLGKMSLKQMNIFFIVQRTTRFKLGKSCR